LRWALIPLALLLAGFLFLLRHNRERDVGGTSDQTYTLQNTGAVTGTMVPGVDLQGFTDHLKTAINSGDGSPVDLTGVGFDNMGNLTTEGKTRLAAMSKLLSDNTSLKVTLTTYGRTLEDSTARANSIKSALAATGIASDRLSVQPEIGAGMPKVAFTK
jgi:hypothetical protein